MLLKYSPRQHESIVKEWQWYHLLKYLLEKQQIQQMNAVEQDTSFIIFYKLKHLFFEQNLEEEQIISFLKEDPIKAIDGILLTITQQYNRKVDQIVEPLREDKNHLLTKLEQVSKQLQRSLDQNQELKAIIQKQQDVNKEAELKVHQQQMQIDKNKEIIVIQVNQKNTVKSQALKLFEKNRQLSAENGQIKEHILNTDNQILQLKSLSNNLKLRNQQLSIQYHHLEHKLAQMSAELEGQNQQNYLLREKVTEKQQFIASFVNQYNRIHIFGKRSGDSKSCKMEEKQEEEKDELKGFNFNQFQRESITSKKSLNSSIVQSEQQMDDKFQTVDATYQKLKSLMVFKNVESSHKKYEVLQNSLLLKNGKVQIKSVNNSMIKSQKSDKHKSKGKITTVFSKNYAQKQMIHTPSSNHNDQKNCVNSLMEKKLFQNNQQISKLQQQIASLNNQYMEQRENITEMEGGYELQIDELKSQLTFIKNKFNQTYQNYLLAKLQLQTCQQKLQELQMEIEQMKQQHGLYCSQLKNRCKRYVTTKIDEVQKEYQLMKQQIVAFNQRKDQHQSQQNNLQLFSNIINQSNHHQHLNVQSNNESTERQQNSINLGHEIFQKIYIPNNQSKNIKEVDSLEKNKAQNQDLCCLLKDQSVQFDSSISFNIYNKYNQLSLDSTVYSESIFGRNIKLCLVIHQPISLPTKTSILTINDQIDEIYCPSCELVNFSIDSNIGSMSLLPLQKKLSFFKNSDINILGNSSVDVLNEQKSKINSQQTDFHTFQSENKEQRSHLAAISHFSLINESISCSSKTPSINKQQSEISFFKTTVDLVANSPKCQWLQQIYETTEYVLQRSNAYESLKSLNDQSSISIQEGDKKYQKMQLFARKEQANLQQAVKDSPDQNLTIPRFCQDQMLSNSSYSQRDKEQNLQEQSSSRLQNSFCYGEELSHSVTSNSLLNKAMIAGDSFIKQSTAVSVNLQSKSNHGRRIQQNQVDISPWFFEDRKQNEEEFKNSIINYDQIPLQIGMHMNEIEMMRLRNYLRTHTIKLIFQQIVTRKYFKKPMNLSRKLLIFITKLNEERQTFLLSKSKLYCLQNDKEIKFEDSKYIDSNNFMFGQSEVIITGDGHLVIRRKGKKNKLDGNLEDGQRIIEAYVVCTYRIHPQP